MYLEFINEEQRQSQYAELGTTEEIVRDGTRYLIEWLENHPYLPTVKDEDFIRNVLLVCKNRLEVAKQQLENYYVARAMIPEIFSNRREFLIEFEDLCRRGFLLLSLPKLTPEGHRIAIFNGGEHTAENLPTVTTLYKVMSILFDAAMKKDQHKGYIIILDASNISASFIPLLISYFKNYITRFMKIYKNRSYKVYVVNLSPTLQWLMDSITNMLPKKLANKVIFWGKNVENLVEVLPKNILPSNYGGDEKCIQELRNEVVEYYREFYDWICEQENVKADISKMSPENKFGFSEFEFGVDGSFRNVSWE